MKCLQTRQVLDLPGDPFAHFPCTERGLSFGDQVGGSQPLAPNSGQSLFNEAGVLNQPEAFPEHHGEGKYLPGRVGEVFPGQIVSCAVVGLVHRRSAV